MSDKTFLVSASAPTATYDVTLYYAASEFAVWGASAGSLNILKTSGPVSAATTAAINTSTARSIFGPTNTEYRSYKASFTGFSGFAVTNATVILPLEWLRFSGRLIEKTARLDWALGFELANEGFQVERSTDGFAFEAIGYVVSKGDSFDEVRYAYEDPLAAELGARTVFYRIRQIDRDGGYSFSKTIAVEVPGSAQTIAVWPVPADGELWLDSGEIDFEGAIFEISDPAGRLVFSEKATAALSVFNVAELPSGAYFGRLVSPERRVLGSVRILKN